MTYHLQGWEIFVERSNLEQLCMWVDLFYIWFVALACKWCLIVFIKHGYCRQIHKTVFKYEPRKRAFQGSKEENMLFLTTQHANRSISLLKYFYLQVLLFNKKEHMIVQRNSVLQCAHQQNHAFFLLEFSYF